MATIVTRIGKGSALTFLEVDDNFENLNTDKLELADLSVTQNTASGAGTLSYNNANGVFSYTPPDLSTFNTLTTTGSTNLHSTSTTPLLLTNPAGTDNGFRISANQALGFNVVGALEIKTFNDFRMQNTILFGTDDGTHSMIHRLHASEATISARNTANTEDVNLTLRGENLFLNSNDDITISGAGITELKNSDKTALEVDQNEASFYVPLKVTKTGQGNISDGDETGSLTFGIRGDDDDAFLGYASMEYDVNNGNVFNITGYDDGITTFNGISLLQVRPDRAAFLDNSLFFQKFTNDVAITPGAGLAYTFESADGDQSLTISDTNIIVKTNDAEIMRFSDNEVNIQGLIYPAADGTVGQVLTTDGAGNLTFEDATGGGISAVEDDPIPLLGGDLNVNSFRIVSLDDDIQLVAEETTVGPNIEKSSITISYDNGISLQADDGITLTADSSSLVLTAVDLSGGTTAITLTHTGVITVEGDLDVTNAEMVSVSNGDILITPNGTGATKIKNINYNKKIHGLGTTSGTITPDVENGNVQTITLDGNLTFSAFSNPVAGQSLTLIIDTNGTGRTLTSTMKFAGASKTLSTTDTTDIISVFYDGTTYWASLSKGFA